VEGQKENLMKGRSRETINGRREKLKGWRSANWQLNVLRARQHREGKRFCPERDTTAGESRPWNSGQP